MNTELTTSSRNELTPAEIASASTDELKRELARSLNLSAEHLVRIALIWQELTRRGEDLSDLRTGLTEYLPDIAAGRLDANVVVRFAGRKTHINALRLLPAEEQRRLLDSEIDVVDDNGDIARARLDQIPAAQVRFVLSDHGIRPIPEQRRLRLSGPTRRKKKPTSRARIYFDENGWLRIGRRIIRRGDEPVTKEQIIVALDTQENRNG